MIKERTEGEKKIKTEKIECKCHVCGTVFNHETTSPCFLHTSSRDRDGRPVFSCGKHTAEEIKNAFFAKVKE